jgi:nitrogen regulatory protein PII
MKMIMIAYNEAIDMEVMEMLGKCGLENYTKITETFGRGASSGTHLGTDIWPGLNNVLYVASPDDVAQKVFAAVRELRKSLGKEGVKAFLWPLEEITAD